MLNQDWLKNVLDECKKYGYRTTPFFPKGYEINGARVPARKFKDGQDYKSVAQYKDAVSIGVVLDNLILLDYDGNKGDVMDLDDLADELDLFEMPIPAQVNADGDSIHWLFKLPSDVDATFLADSNDGAWNNIDIKRGTQLMHIKEGKTLALLAADEWDECPTAIIDKLRGGKSKADYVSDGDSALWDAVEDAEERTPLEDVASVVNSLAVNYADSHDAWFKVGMAIWYETHGSDEGLELFKQFSRQVPSKYDEQSIESRWPSFRPNPGTTPVTIGTLKHFEKKTQFIETHNELSAMTKRIMSADEETLEFEIYRDIRNTTWSDMHREQLANSIKLRLKELTGATIRIGMVRDLIKPTAISGELVDDLPVPVWCEPWIYVGTHGEFFHLDKNRHINTDTFNMEFTKLVPITGENGQKASASRFVMNHGFIEVADRLEYLPWENERFVNLKGVNVFNSFDVRSLPRFDNTMTSDGEKAVQVIRDHIQLLCNDSPKDALILEQWFAHQVQHRGVKILWAPLISSIEGTGKGRMEELLRRLLGDSNVGVVQPEQVKSQYKASWAVGSCVNILNELKVAGSNRHEVANSLKPMITDATIRVEDKHVKAFEARNTANYIAFTNYIDAIPLTETTRRWWPIRMNLDDLNDIGVKFGLSKDEYFDRLTWAVEEQWAQLGLWFSEYEITGAFKALKQAPETQFKLAMVATEESKINGLDEARQVLQEGGDLIHPKAVHYENFLEAINAKLWGLDTLTKRDLSVIMSKLGFTPHTGQVSINKKSTRIWTKGDYSNEQVRGFFE